MSQIGTGTISTSHSPPPHSPVTPSNEPSSGAPVYSEVNRTAEFTSTGVYSQTVVGNAWTLNCSLVLQR